MGFPNRTSRAALGPKYVNKRPVRDGSKEIGAPIANTFLWNDAGMSQTCDRAWALLHIAGGVATITAAGEAWDPDAGFAPTPAYVAPGHYRLTYPATVKDENDNDVAPNLVAAKAHPQTTSDYRGVALVSGGGLIVDVFVRDAAGAAVDCDTLVEVK
jgi:hypothetical protein